MNFWQPRGKSQFKLLQPGEPFLFKLHEHYERCSARDSLFGHHKILPVSFVWHAFGEKNGAPFYFQMRGLIEGLNNRKVILALRGHGCE